MQKFHDPPRGKLGSCFETHIHIHPDWCTVSKKLNEGFKPLLMALNPLLVQLARESRQKMDREQPKKTLPQPCEELLGRNRVCFRRTRFPSPPPSPPPPHQLNWCSPKQPFAMRCPSRCHFHDCPPSSSHAPPVDQPCRTNQAPRPAGAGFSTSSLPPFAEGWRLMAQAWETFAGARHHALHLALFPFHF